MDKRETKESSKALLVNTKTRASVTHPPTEQNKEREDKTDEGMLESVSSILSTIL